MKSTVAPPTFLARPPAPTVNATGGGAVTQPDTAPVLLEDWEDELGTDWEVELLTGSPEEPLLLETPTELLVLPPDVWAPEELLL